MKDVNLNLKELEARRHRLGMSYSALANRSGVPEITVQRILGGKFREPSFRKVVAIADALGVDLHFAPRPEREVREQQARRVARRVVALVQGTSGLEGQAVDAETLADLEEKTVHELLAGSARRLWGDG